MITKEFEAAVLAKLEPDLAYAFYWMSLNIFCMKFETGPCPIDKEKEDMLKEAIATCYENLSGYDPQTSTAFRYFAFKIAHLWKDWKETSSIKS